jgi:Zn-dependent protease
VADAFDRFSTRARRVITLAVDEAQSHNHDYVGPEHILLGILAEKEGIAVSLLRVLNVDLSATRGRVDQAIGRDRQPLQSKPSLTAQAKRVIELSVDEARSHHDGYIGTEHLLLGLLREKGIISEILEELGASLSNVRAQRELLPKENLRPTRLSLESEFAMFTPTSPPQSAKGKLPVTISPVFVLVVLITVVAGGLIYWGGFNPSLTIFVFVTSGWLVSLCLHEFGHAAVAWLGGDTEVAGKGYLTLNPLKYYHDLLSIVLPLAFLLMGGLGLPGGAVYLNPAAIRKKSTRSLTSAAGPVATAIYASVLLIPFVSRLPDADMSHFEFWAALGLLAYLQITAVFLCSLPIPGLDSFGVIEPYLPVGILKRIEPFRTYTFFLLALFFFTDTPLSRGFWTVIDSICSLVNLDPGLISESLRLFQFWKF